jgi:hypothetical protein
MQLMDTLSEDVLYSCLYWIDHVCAVLTSANNVWNRVQSFLALHLLHWFEAMSILKRSRDTIKLLQDLVDWIEVSGPILLICSHLTLYIFPNQPSELVHDACRFAEAFHDTIPYHPLSVYYSALPFAPKHSTLYQIFHDRNAFPDVVAGFEKSWRPSLLHIISVDGLKDAVAFSPDGKRVAVAWASYIRVLDLTSGSDALSPLRNRSTVAFSHVGSRIVHRHR